MSNGLVAILQKELKRFFTDGRMVFGTVLLPGLLIYAIYSFMGLAMASNLTVSSDYVPENYAVNLPASLAEATEAAGLDFKEIDAAEAAAIKERIAAKEADLLVVFPADFDEQLAADLGGIAAPEAGADTGVNAQPEVQLFYNSTRVESSTAQGQMFSLLESYKEALQPLFSINAGDAEFDLASEEDSAGFMFASLLPMLLMIFLYSGCLAVAPESIAGEKERGTIATLLVTPLKRWELALGKILSLCIIALLAGASSFVGVMLSLPNLLSLTGGGDSSMFAGTALYAAQDYLMLLVVILSTVVLFVGLISIISAFARTVKEANTYVMPLMMIVLLVGATAMFQTSSETNVLLYLIPVYNSVQSMIAIFGFAASPLTISVTVGINLLVSALCVIALTRMFGDERIMFGK